MKTTVVQEMYNAKKITLEQCQEVKEDLESAADGMKELECDGKKIKVYKKHCSICKKEGHNKRTCSQR